MEKKKTVNGVLIGGAAGKNKKEIILVLERTSDREIVAGFIPLLFKNLSLPLIKSA
ncbi:MAG: hypothetical protein PHV51_08345 [Methanosarcinaceae archaeon]|nr:hypothetical protein [Methanosarcinaceae archaeon]